MHTYTNTRTTHAHDTHTHTHTHDTRTQTPTYTLTHIHTHTHTHAHTTYTHPHTEFYLYQPHTRSVERNSLTPSPVLRFRTSIPRSVTSASITAVGIDLRPYYSFVNANNSCVTSLDVSVVLNETLPLVRTLLWRVFDSAGVMASCVTRINMTLPTDAQSFSTMAGIINSLPRTTSADKLVITELMLNQTKFIPVKDMTPVGAEVMLDAMQDVMTTDLIQPADVRDCGILMILYTHTHTYTHDTRPHPAC